MRNGQEHYEDVKVGKLLPNEDGTFQKTVTLKAEPDEWRKNEYSCVVEHKSKTFRKTLTEKEIRTNNGKRLCTDVTLMNVHAERPENISELLCLQNLSSTSC